MLKRRKAYLLLTLLFTLLFVTLITLGSYLLSVNNKLFGIAVFLFSFVTVLGQICCLALFLREHSRYQMTLRTQSRQPDIQKSRHV